MLGLGLGLGLVLVLVLVLVRGPGLLWLRLGACWGDIGRSRMVLGVVVISGSRILGRVIMPDSRHGGYSAAIMR